MAVLPSAESDTEAPCDAGPTASEPMVDAAPPFTPTSGKKLFVGNLPFDWTDEPLRALFAGIGIGILLGTMPIPCPGLPQPLKLGLAGGPLIIAILIGGTVPR